MHKNKNIITAPVRDGCWGTIDSIFPYDPEHEIFFCVISNIYGRTGRKLSPELYFC